MAFGARCSRLVRDTDGYGSSETVEAALLVSLRDDPPVVVANHQAPEYEVIAYANAEAQTVCVGDSEDRMDVSQTLDAASEPEVWRPISSTATRSGDLVDVGRVSDDVSAITVRTAGGRGVEAIVKNGYYSVLLEAGTDPAALTYDIEFEDGSTVSLQDE